MFILALSLTSAVAYTVRPLADQAVAEASRKKPPRIKVPGNFTSIQQAIDAAPDVAAIIVEAGVYEETLWIAGKEIPAGRWTTANPRARNASA